MGIDHNKLLVKLEHYGIRGFCHKLLTNYLLKREQYINFKGTDSEVQEVEFGVPQGSVLFGSMRTILPIEASEQKWGQTPKS